MKILHCCLASFYIDKFGYQENILPKIHKMQGLDVEIIASTETYLANKTLGYVEAASYLNEDGIPVTRIPYVKWLPFPLVKKLRIYNNLKHHLERIRPDVIFMHDVQFLSVFTVIAYAKLFPNVRIYADCHTDHINSARGWLSKNILHKIVYKFAVKAVEPYVTKFWGVTPLRSRFLSEVYGVSPDKVDLLVMGFDDLGNPDLVDDHSRNVIRQKIRADLGVLPSDILLITGGKIDRRKEIHSLLQALSIINRVDVKLLMFGSPTPDMQDEISELVAKVPNVLNVGWCNQRQICEYLVASDLAFFPGTHSVVWEQLIGLGLPAVFKKWDGMEHVDLDGNCIMLQSNDINNIVSVIESLVDSPEKLASMKSVAISKGKELFSYSNIARRAIEQIKSIV